MKERLQGSNSSSEQVIVSGDTNINNKQYCIDNKTADYLDMLLDSGLMAITCQRDFSNFNKDFFLKEISEADFVSLIGDDVNESVNAFAESFQQITDKHAPVR